MKIDDNLLTRLEHLSAIKINEDKKEAIKAQLGEILSFVENLNSTNIPEHIPHRNHPTLLREDEPKDANIAQSVLKHAPKSEDNFFIVPKIVE